MRRTFQVARRIDERIIFRQGRSPGEWQALQVVKGIEVLKIDFGLRRTCYVKGHAGVDPLERCFRRLS